MQTEAQDDYRWTDAPDRRMKRERERRIISHLPDRLVAIRARSIARNVYSSPNGPEHRCLIVVLCPDLEWKEQEKIGIRTQFREFHLGDTSANAVICPTKVLVEM